MAERSAASEQHAVWGAAHGYSGETETGGAEAMPLGYKRTDVGLIPKDWEVFELGQVADFANGRPHEKNVTPYGRFSLITLDSIGIDGKLKEDHKKVNFYDGSLAEGDIVAILSDIAHGNLLGLCDVIPESNKYVLNQRVGRIRLLSRVDSRYVRLQISRNQPHFKNRGQGSSQRHIYKRDFDSLVLPMPSLDEQRAIATALSDADALIESLDRLIAKKRAIKQAAMQQLLTGQTRLPGFTGEWETKRLGDVLDFQVGFPFKSKFFKAEQQGVRIVRNGDLKGDEEPLYYDGPFDRSFEINDGDVLIGMDGEFVPHLWNRGTALLNQRVGRIIGSPRLVVEFAWYRLAGPLREIERSTSATTVKHLSHGDIAKITLPLPEIREQAAIATALSDMDTEIEALKRRRDKARQIKQGMMQQLLTGRVRLI